MVGVGGYNAQARSDEAFNPFHGVAKRKTVLPGQVLNRGAPVDLPGKCPLLTAYNCPRELRAGQQRVTASRGLALRQQFRLLPGSRPYGREVKTEVVSDQVRLPRPEPDADHRRPGSRQWQGHGDERVHRD